MARVKDLWWTTTKPRRKTARHPDCGGNKDAKRWLAIWQAPDGQEKTRAFATKTAAQHHGARMEADAERGLYVDPKAARTLVRTYAEQWEANQIGSAATVRIVDNALRLHILPPLGGRQIATVRRSDVQALVKSMTGDYAPGTVRNVYEVAARMFAAAADDKLIADTPCRKITLPAMPADEVVPLTVEQVGALADAVPARYRALVVFLAGSGLRIGEALGLRVADVDFLRRTVRVERQRYQNGSVGPTKGRRSRTVPLGQVAVDELAAHLAAYPSGEWLFTTERGDPLLYRAWKAVWQAARTAAKVDANTHGLRHFFASMLIGGGASVKQVQRVLGHSSPVITLRTYAHLWPDEEDRTRSVADAALANLRRNRDGTGNDGESSAAGQSG